MSATVIKLEIKFKQHEEKNDCKVELRGAQLTQIFLVQGHTSRQ